MANEEDRNVHCDGAGFCVGRCDSLGCLTSGCLSLARLLPCLLFQKTVQYASPTSTHMESLLFTRWRVIEAERILT